jgi:hypothetical protein
MLDLRLVEIRDVLPVTQLERRVIEGLDVVSAHGEDFNFVHEVRINGVRSPSVTVLSGTHLLAQIPESELNNVLISFYVISARFTRTKRKSEIKFRFNGSAVAGLERLAQLFLKVLTQRPSTFSKMGGGLVDAVGRGGNTVSMTADLHRAVSVTRQQLLAQQAGSTVLPLDEQLQDAQLLDAKYDATKRSVVGVILLKNRKGASSTLGLPL